MSKKNIKTNIYKDKKETSSFDDGNGVMASFGRRVEWWPLNKGYLSDTELLKSNRNDYGRTIDIRVPQGYHAQVQKSWEMYETDRLFRYLIDRCIDFGANGSEWEVPLNKIDTDKVDIAAKSQEREDKEKLVWDTWAANINEDVPNVMTGIDEINKWIIKHLLLCGMTPLQWEWGDLEVDGEVYIVPIRMTVSNPLSIALDRKTDSFTDESIFLKKGTQNKIKEGYKEELVGLYSDPDKNLNYIELSVMGKNKTAKREAFCVKYNWSPGDNTALVYGKNVQVGQGLYPTPPFVGLFETLILRKALKAADIAILDGIIHYIIDWEIGDNTVIEGPGGKRTMPNQPRPAKKDSSGNKIEKSTIEMAREIITSENRSPVMQLFHPYYMKLNIRMPDVTTLISAEKYIQTTIEIYEAFGILVSPPTVKIDLGDINIFNFEEMLENIRQRHIKRFWESLAKEIIKRNKGKLINIPNYIFNVLNTKSNDFKNSIYAIGKIGKVSTRTLQQIHGLNNKVEKARIAKEVLSGEKEMYDKNTPVSFVQSVVGKDRNTSNIDRNLNSNDKNSKNKNSKNKDTTVSISANTQTGRPKGAKDKNKRTVNKQ